MLRLEAIQDDDGAESAVKAELFGAVTNIEGPEGTVRVSGSLFPSNHWHPGVLAANSIIDTLTGNIARVNIQNAGTEIIEAEGRRVRARKFVYSGDVDATAWYDSFGRWTKLQFLAKGDSSIEYHCVECGI